MFGMQMGKMGGVGQMTLAQRIAYMFANSEPGAWYDPSDMSTLFQDEAGTTPVTAVEQPVGRMLDKSGRGNHATQATTTKRPVLSRRVNLLTKTEQFDDAAWTKSRCSVTSNAVVGPDGLMSAEKVIADAQSNPHFVSATAAYKSGTTCRVSVYAKAGEWDTVMLFGASNTIGGRFDLSLGTYVSNVIGVPIAPTITPVVGGWYLLALSFVATADNQEVSIRITPSGGNSGAPGNGVAGLYLWGASLTLATDAHLPYQWVNTATDYDADPNKFPAYLRADGVDDSMLSINNIDLSYTNQVMAVVGVMRTPGSVSGWIYNQGQISPNRLNSLYCNHYSNDQFQSSGPTGNAYATSPTYSDNQVLTGIGDIQNNSAVLRRNGAQVATSAVVQGGTTYGNAPIQLLGSSGSSDLFNGRLYSLILRGAQSSLSQIEATELYIKQKMRMP